MRMRMRRRSTFGVALAGTIGPMLVQTLSRKGFFSWQQLNWLDTSAMNTATVEQSLVYSFIEFLQGKKTAFDASKESEKSESVEVAVQCLADTFGIRMHDAAEQARLSLAPATLCDIVQIYLKKKDAAGTGSPTRAPGAPSGTPGAPSDAAAAEELKKRGNACLAQKDYAQAAQLYSQAIEADGTNAVYYCNRAAAHAHLGKDALAKDDCLKAIALDATYSKAYTRLGLAEANLDNHGAAVAAYEKALAFDPTNDALKTSLAQARQKADSPRPSSASPSSPMGGMPGGLDFASLLQNPQMMKMAAEFARSGGMAELMKNPNVAQMAQNMLGKDPDALAQMAKSLGDAGADSGAGAGAEQ